MSRTCPTTRAFAYLVRPRVAVARHIKHHVLLAPIIPTLSHGFGSKGVTRCYGARDERAPEQHLYHTWDRPNPTIQRGAGLLIWNVQARHGVKRVANLASIRHLSVMEEPTDAVYNQGRIF